MERYFGSYQRLDCSSKKEGSLLLSADNIVGDLYEIVFDDDLAYAKNRFGAKVGHFSVDFSRQLRILNARDWKLTARLSLVAFSSEPEPGEYWAEMAVICYEPTYTEAFEAFSETVSSMLAEGIRPEIDLGEQATSKVIDSKGSWRPETRADKPAKDSRTVIMKSQRKMSEALIEKGRAGNIGCYAVSIAFIIAVVVAIVLLVKTFLF